MKQNPHFFPGNIVTMKFEKQSVDLNMNLQYRKCTGNMKLQAAGNNCLFWTSPNAFYIFVVLLLSVVLRQCLVLHGISMLLLLQIWKISGKWLNFVRTDQQYDLFVKFCTGYFHVVMNEYRDLITGKYGRMKMALAQVALRYAVYESRAYIISHGAHARKVIRQQFMRDLRNYIRHSPIDD